MIDFFLFALFLFAAVFFLVVWPLMMHPTLPVRKKFAITGIAFLVIVGGGLSLYLWLGVPEMARF